MRIDRRFITRLLILLNISSPVKGKDNPQKKRGKIIVEIELPKDYSKDSLLIQYSAFDFVASPLWKNKVSQVKYHSVKWILFSDTPLLGNLIPILGKGAGLHLYEPGDSIHINLKDGIPVYSGRNADKFKMIQEMATREAVISIPMDPKYDTANALRDYLEWNGYLNKKLDLLQNVYASYKSHVTPFAYDYLKANAISEIEYNRLMKFGSLVRDSVRAGLSPENLGQIFDSTAYNESVKWLHSYTGIVRNYYYYYDFVRKSVQRKYNFNNTHDSLNSVRRKMIYADVAQKTYKGNMLQGFFVYLLTEQGLKEHTLKTNDPEIDTLLAAFYAQPGYASYKEYVKKYETKIRDWVVAEGNKAPGFSLSDKNGRQVKKTQFDGKIVVLNFFKPNCKECIEMNNALDKVQRTFKEDTSVAFLYISVNKNRNISSPDNSQTSTNKIYLHPGNPEEYQSIIKHYNILSYPRVLVLDSWGKFLYNGKPDTGYRINTLPDPTHDGGTELSRKIYEQLALKNDGPYVIHLNDSVISYVIQGANIKKSEYSRKNNIRLDAQTDSYSKKFPIILKKIHQKEPSQYTRPEKLFVLSDIEGNFDAFRKLLQAGKIIDSQYNWIYGTGHLVFAGDMFDRGKQVTECLWLIYSLEEKAKAAGGYVHFILGNHEIMNLTGDLRYVDSKYKKNAALMELSYPRLFDQSSELGKWLRTKNIIEKIGDLLFVHGGISKEINNLQITIEQINELSRLYYSNNFPLTKKIDKTALTIYNPETSPFWNRGYYYDDLSRKTPETVIDSTLKKFKISKIITGHTIVSNEISLHYNGKVINTDTKHAKGKSEALLIENNNYYRINSKGEKEMLPDRITLTTK